MGYEVIGFGVIETTCNKIQLRKLIDKLKNNNPNFYNVEVYDFEIVFEMSGNKGIDYAPLDKVKEYCEKEKIPIVRITVSEYMECGDGYYWEKEE